MNKRNFIKTSAAASLGALVPANLFGFNQKAAKPIKLYPFQQEVVDIFNNTDRNILCIWPRGSGKTFLLEHLYNLNNVPYKQPYHEELGRCRVYADDGDGKNVYVDELMAEWFYCNSSLRDFFSTDNERITIFLSPRVKRIIPPWNHKPEEEIEFPEYCRNMIKIASETNGFISVKNFDEIPNQIYSSKFIKEIKEGIKINPQIKAEYMCRDFLNY